MPSAFFEQSAEIVIKELESFSLEILCRYPISVKSVISINYEYNATLKVETNDGQLFALRINTNSPRTTENLKAEIAWVRHLADDARVKVPHPVMNSHGDFHTSILHNLSGRMFHCVLYSWIKGSELEDEPEDDQLFALGAAMATMHMIAPQFTLPVGASLPIFDHALWWTEDFLLSEKSALDAEAKQLISQALSAIKAGVDELYIDSKPIIIHADMHGGNVLWHEGNLSVIDFDDSGFGLPLQDLATALYYLDTPEQEAAFRRGYESIARVPECSEKVMKMLFLQRRIILLNYLYETSNLEHKSMIPEYQAETFRRIRTYLELKARHRLSEEDKNEL
jgi:Ser/Thr protein kinase RdoA (MazF antagonist)